MSLQDGRLSLIDFILERLLTDSGEGDPFFNSISRSVRMVILVKLTPLAVISKELPVVAIWQCNNIAIPNMGS